MEARRARVGSNGRLVIPAAFRSALGVADGGELLLRLIDGELRVNSRAGAVRRAQELVRQHVPAGVSLVEELVDNRRREAEFPRY